VRTVEERLELLEEALARLIREREVDEEGGGNSPVRYHATPVPGDRTPLRWRGLTTEEVERRWSDLCLWVEWLVDAFDVYTGRMSQSAWWRSAGAVEELSALRDWHRELVDVVVDDAGEPEERAAAAARARDLVYWHETRIRVCERLLGAPTQPLLARAAQATAETEQLAGEARTQRVAAFGGFLASANGRARTGGHGDDRAYVE
jgi:hypothetical protein